MDRYVALHGTEEFLLTDRMMPFKSVKDVEASLQHFHKTGHLLDAKIYKLVEI